MDNRPEYDEYRKRVQERQVLLEQTCRDLFDGIEKITLEIGCGHGHWLVGYSGAHPDEFCVGIDLKTKRIERARRKSERLRLDNLYFLKTEAGEFLQAMPSELKLERVIVIFPDPWPKKRHHKNRLIQQRFLDALGDRTVPGAQLCFRTDHRPYFQWAVEHIDAHPAWQIQQGAPWPFENETIFQSILKRYSSLVAVKAAPSI